MYFWLLCKSFTRDMELCVVGMNAFLRTMYLLGVSDEWVVSKISVGVVRYWLNFVIQFLIYESKAMETLKKVFY